MNRFHHGVESRYVDDEEETESRSHNPLQTLAGILSGTGRRLMSIQDVIEALLGGGNFDEIATMFGNDEEDEEDSEDSKEDIDSSMMENSEPDPYSMDEDGYEQKSGDIVTDSKDDDGDAEEEEGDLASNIRLRGLGGDNGSNGPNI